MMSVRVTYPGEALRAAGIDPGVAWADDAGLTDGQRAALRAVGRSEVERRYRESRAAGRAVVVGQGMAEDGRQPGAAAFLPGQVAAYDRPTPASDAQLAALDGMPPPASVSPLAAVAMAMAARGPIAPAVQPGAVTAETERAAGGALLPLAAFAAMVLL